MGPKQQKALAEQSYEFRQWKRWRRERVEALLQGPYAEPARALLAFLKTMTGPTALVDFIRSGPSCDANANTRYEVLALVDAVIMRRRERMGLPPFDDALPGQPLNVFLILRELLAPNSIHDFRLMAAPPGAEPGLINEISATRITENVE